MPKLDNHSEEPMLPILTLQINLPGDDDVHALDREDDPKSKDCNFIENFWTSVFYDLESGNPDLPLHLIGLNKEARTQKKLIEQVNGYIKKTRPSLNKKNKEGNVSTILYAALILLFCPLLIFVLVIDCFGVMYRNYHKWKNDPSCCCLSSVIYFILMIAGLVFVSLRNLFRMVFYPLYTLHSAVNNFTRNLCASLVGIALTIPTFTFSIFVVLSLAKIALIKQPHLLDKIAKVKLLQQNIPYLSDCFSWIKLPGISTEVNSMLHNITVDGLIVSLFFYCVYILIQKNCCRSHAPEGQKQPDFDDNEHKYEK